MRQKTFVAALAIIAILTAWAAPAALAVPLQAPSPPREAGLVVPSSPQVSAASWILYDADADVVLSGSDPDGQRPMASTTKIMTALLAMKYGDLDETVEVSQRAADVGEAEVGLVAGEKLQMRHLVKALVVRSANDASMAVAEHIGGSVEGFVEMMNAEAKAMGLENTHFANPHGLDMENHYSSPRDLLEMGLAAMSYPEFREMATTVESDFPNAPDGTRRSLSSTNLLLERYPGTIGVKTGYTGRAGLVFVSGAVRDGRTLFAVVMGSEGERAHFADAETLLDWGFERFRSVAIVAAGNYEPPAPVRVEADEPEAEPEPQPEPEPVVVTNVRRVDTEPPELLEALGWMGRLLERSVGG